MDVVLIDLANDPLTKLYGAYRTCYTPKTPREVWEDIAAGTVKPDKIAQFVEERLKTGHVSPLEQVVFWFGISGVSRSLRHQFVRHRLPVDAGDLLHQLLELRCPSCVAPALWHHVLQALLVVSGEADVALRLLLEGDADAVA